MFRWLTRSPRRSPQFPRARVRLMLECLERRACPAGPALQINTFTATVLAGHTARLSGTVQDDNPASVQLTFSGAVTGTTAADASGNFSYSTTNATLGGVTATAVDGANNTASASTTISKAAPSVTLTLNYPSQTAVTLQGAVTDLDAASLTVRFTGTVTGSTRPNADGKYSFTASETALGNATATVTDLWGQSAQATARVAPPLQMYGFTAIHGTGNSWTFTGDVEAATATGLTVTFSGLPEVNNQTTTVNENDEFGAAFDLAPGEGGTVTATVTDCWGQTASQSDPVQN